MNRRTITLAVATLSAGLLLAACGGDDTGGGDRGGAASPVADGARQIEVTGEDFAFDPEEITAEAGEDLSIVLTSEDMLHDLTIDELDFRIDVGRGDTAEGGLTVAEPGTYTYYCSVPGHRPAGMEGTLTVE